MKHILIALCVLFALASSVEAGDRIHVIRKGETLSEIAKRYLGRADAYPELVHIRANGITDPDRIYAGAKLLIPNRVRSGQKAAKVVRTHVTVKIVNVRLSKLAGNMPHVHLVGSISISVTARYLAVSTLPSRTLPSSSSSFLLLPSSTCYSSLINEVALRVGVDSDLIRAVVRTESACNRMAKSPKGALGLMQLMPDTLRLYHISDPFDAYQNVEAGARHLKKLIHQYGEIPLVLAAYNAGPGAVNKHQGVPPYPETRNYVARVRGWLHKFQPKE